MRFFTAPAKLMTLLAVAAVTAGCASSDDQQKKINMAAEQRANVLAAGLPVEYGPLKVMSAKAKQGTVELMMIYNQDGGGETPQSLMRNAVSYYCSNNMTKKVMDAGVNYRLMLRNSRGQLLLDQAVNQANCQPAEQ